jgi:hypothetical protein
VPLGKSIYGHGPDFYFIDEDGTNDVDETPPDLHQSAGMVCADCHIGVDVHGDGFIYTSERYQVGIRCEDCHGTVHAAIEEDPGDGYFHNSAGNPHRRIRRALDGQILLQLATDPRELAIPQIHDILESGSNPRMVDAMGLKPSGFAHPDQMECYACHSGWRQTCMGCHVQINDDLTQFNRTTGEVSRGAISSTRDFNSNDFYTLGVNRRGKIVPLCSSMTIFVTYISDFQVQHRDRVRTTTEGDIGFGWNPFLHHTVSRTPMNCDTCHPVESAVDPPNQARLRETYGFGNGQFLATDGDGMTYDLTAFLDEQGELIGSFPHPNTGPVTAASRERALSIVVVPHPRGAESSPSESAD